MKIIKYIFKPDPMETLDSCIGQAIESSVGSEVDVDFDFNGQTIKIDHKKLIEKYKKQYKM